MVNWIFKTQQSNGPKPGSGRRRAIGSQVGLLVLACALWCINWIPIQSSGYVLTASALVSQAKWKPLLELSHSRETGSTDIQWLSFRRSRTGTGSSELDVAQVRMQLGIVKPLTIGEVERELDRLTHHAESVVSLAPDAKQLRSCKWSLEVVSHQMQRFRLDREREGVDLTTLERSSPFRQASYSTRFPRAASKPLKPNDREAWKRLIELEQDLSHTIQALEQNQSQIALQSEGRIAFTGSPRISAMGGRLSTPRILIVSGLSCCVGLFLLAIQVQWKSHRIHARVKAWIERPSQPRQYSEPSGSAVASRSLADPMNSESQLESSTYPASARDVASWARKLQIPYWGEAYCRLLVADKESMRPGDESTGTTSEGVVSLEVNSNAMACEKIQPMPDPKLSGRKRASLLRAFGDGMLFVWLAFFCYRFIMDSMWRDLLFRAPLAAFSSLFFGI